MPCVEYHLLLVLICPVKSGISLDLKKNWVLNKFLAPLLGTDESLVAMSKIQ